MNNQNKQSFNTENSKKGLIGLVVLTMFAFSYHYYSGGSEKSLKAPIKTQEKLSIKPKKPLTANTSNPAPKADPKVEAKVEAKGAPGTAKTPAEQPKQDLKSGKIIIKPTEIKDLLASASETSGKNDPFSYSESKFIPFRGISENPGPLPSMQGGLPSMQGLPVPPPLDGSIQGDPPTSSVPAPPAPEPVIIRGFMGNKVIAQIRGITEALAVNDSLRGVKVLKVDPNNLSCVFMIDGKRVTKTMKPIDSEREGIAINYINN